MTPQSAQQNAILAALGSAVCSRLLPELQPVGLVAGEVLYEAGDPIGQVYFPSDCIVSLISTAADGCHAELAMTGNDGMVGVPLLLGHETMGLRAVVQSAGGAFRLSAELLLWEIEQDRNLQHQLLRYTRQLMDQMAQTVVCHRHHTIDQQLCRWLLMSLDRLAGSQIDLTQVQIAEVLGVRREAVLEAARTLQAAGAIAYHRGHIRVLDRSCLLARVCPCYTALAPPSQRVIPAPTQGQDRPRPPHDAASLRKQAESRLRLVSPVPVVGGDAAGRLLHELQVHQIELEMQNDEVANAYAGAEALRARYADIYDFAPLAYVSLDSIGIIRQMNLAGAILFGIKRTDDKPHRFAGLLNPASLPPFNGFLQRVMEGHSSERCQLELLPNAQRGAATVLVEAVRDEDGHECRMVVSDISEAHRLNAALASSEMRQRTLIKSLPDYVLLLDNAGHITTSHSPPEHLGRLTVTDEVIGQPYEQVIVPAIVAPLRQQMAELANDDHVRYFSATVEFGGLTRDFDARLCRVFDSEQNPTGFLMVAHDVTAVRGLRAQQQVLVAALAALGDAVAITDAAGAIEWLNPAFETLTGYSFDEAIHRSLGDLVKSSLPDPIDSAELWNTILAGRLWRGELLNARKDGSQYHAELTVAPVKNEAGEILHFVGIQHDITRRKRLEAELKSLASTDSLTGLANRRHFMARLEQELGRVQRREGYQAALLMLDLDHFKRVNDSLGHAGGDAVLCAFSALLGEELRKVDMAGRIGGEEFAVVLAESDAEAAATFAERLRGKVEQALCARAGRSVAVTVSIGMAQIDAGDLSIDVALERADAALYRAKEGGRNRIESARRRACDLR